MISSMFLCNFKQNLFLNHVFLEYRDFANNNEVIKPNPNDEYQIEELNNHFIRRLQMEILSTFVRPETGCFSQGSIPTVGAFFRFPQRTPSTGSMTRKQTLECFNKPEAFDAIWLK